MVQMFVVSLKAISKRRSSASRVLEWKSMSVHAAVAIGALSSSGISIM